MPSSTKGIICFDGYRLYISSLLILLYSVKVFPILKLVYSYRGYGFFKWGCAYREVRYVYIIRKPS